MCIHRKPFTVGGIKIDIWGKKEALECMLSDKEFCEPMRERLRSRPRARAAKPHIESTPNTQSEIVHSAQHQHALEKVPCWCEE